jgi:hypothetical protein
VCLPARDTTALPFTVLQQRTEPHRLGLLVRLESLTYRSGLRYNKKRHCSGRANRASGRCPAGESMLGGLNSPADCVSAVPSV